MFPDFILLQLRLLNYLLMLLLGIVKAAGARVQGQRKDPPQTAVSSRGNFLFIIFYFAPHRLSLDGTQLGADRFQSKSQASSREVAMLVKDILASKGTNVVTINPTAGLIEATNLMAERRIGVIVILGADDRIVGILSA